MSNSFNVACIQNCAGDDLQANLTEAEALTRAAAAEGADFICLPECFALIAIDNEQMLSAAVEESNDPALQRFRALAAEIGTWTLPRRRSASAHCRSRSARNIPADR